MNVIRYNLNDIAAFVKNMKHFLSMEKVNIELSVH